MDLLVEMTKNGGHRFKRFKESSQQFSNSIMSEECRKAMIPVLPRTITMVFVRSLSIVEDSTTTVKDNHIRLETQQATFMKIDSLVLLFSRNYSATRSTMVFLRKPLSSSLEPGTNRREAPVPVLLFAFVTNTSKTEKPKKTDQSNKQDESFHVVCVTKTRWHLAELRVFGSQILECTESNLQGTCI